MKSTILVMVAMVILGGAGGFFAGMKYQESKSPAGRFGTFQGNRNGQFGQRGGFRPVNGEIISSDDKSITVKLTDGSSKIILLTDNTSINKSTTATKGDLKTGEHVAVFGTENSDGSVTAGNIQLNPVLGVVRGSSNQAQKSSDAREIVVEGSNYKFSPNTITIKKNEKVRILFKSKDGVHDLRVDELNIATRAISAGQEDFVEFTPDKSGTFEFYCSIGNHRAMGMKGTLAIQ